MKLGDVYYYKKTKILLTENNKNDYIFYVINGLYNLIVNKKTYEISTKRIKIIDQCNSLNVKNVIEKNNDIFDINDLEYFGNLLDDKELKNKITNEFFDNLKRYFINDEDMILNSYKKISESINFSMFQNTNNSFVKLEEGKFYNDFLIKSDFYDQNVIKINQKKEECFIDKNDFDSNLWFIFKELTVEKNNILKKLFLGVNLENLMIFIFDENGVAISFVNQIDNRFSGGEYSMISGLLEYFLEKNFSYNKLVYIKGRFNVKNENFNFIEEINEDSIFYGLKLTNINDEIISNKSLYEKLYYLQALKIKNTSLISSKNLLYILRNFFNSIQNTISEKEYKYYYDYNYFDNNYKKEISTEFDTNLQYYAIERFKEDLMSLTSYIERNYSKFENNEKIDFVKINEKLYFEGYDFKKIYKLKINLINDYLKYLIEKLNDEKKKEKFKNLRNFAKNKIFNDFKNNVEISKIENDLIKL